MSVPQSPPVSFLATVKSLSVYPKDNYILAYAVLNQKNNVIKAVTRLTPNELNILITHDGMVRFFTDNKPPKSSTYMHQNVPMFEVKGFTALCTPNQPTITNVLNQQCQPGTAPNMAPNQQQEYNVPTYQVELE